MTSFHSLIILSSKSLLAFCLIEFFEWKIVLPVVVKDLLELPCWRHFILWLCYQVIKALWLFALINIFMKEYVYMYVTHGIFLFVLYNHERNFPSGNHTVVYYLENNDPDRGFCIEIEHHLEWG